MKFFKNLFPGKSKPTGLSAGDIFYTYADGKYALYKLLVKEPDIACYHVLIYKPVDSLPQANELESLPVFALHAPIDQGAFAEVVLLTNKSVLSNELTGYHEYLRQTRDPKGYIPIANGYYETARMLTDKNQHHDAIDAYSKAIDLFPLFFEAIDNRAFCKMDLGLWNDAIADFRLSLQQQPGSLLAEFSIGECYFKMGDYENAKRQFEIAHRIDPAHEAPRLFLKKVEQLIGK